MSKYPEPLPIPREVTKKRLQRRKEMISAARRGVALRVLFIAAELVGYLLWKSSVLLLDMLSTSVDVLASLILIWFIRLPLELSD